MPNYKRKTIRLNGCKMRINPQRIEAIERIEQQRTVSTASLMQSLMDLAPEAITFKSKLMKDRQAPNFLKLKNADDILDRTLSKPTKNISMTGSITRSDLTERELRQMVMRKMAEKNIIDVTPLLEELELE